MKKLLFVGSRLIQSVTANGRGYPVGLLWVLAYYFLTWITANVRHATVIPEWENILSPPLTLVVTAMWVLCHMYLCLFFFLHAAFFAWPCLPVGGTVHSEVSSSFSGTNLWSNPCIWHLKHALTQLQIQKCYSECLQTPDLEPIQCISHPPCSPSSQVTIQQQVVKP
jgi:hypothetical protein